MTITLLRVTIAVEPGWAVGAVPAGDGTLDRDLVTDVDGRPWVPGSSLAGSLRAHLRATDRANGRTGGAAGSPGLECALMGSRPTKRSADEAEVSPLWLLGTRFVPDGGGRAQTEVVGQTRIDRRRGAAAVRSLRTSRTVASGGALTAYLRYDGVFTDDELAALASWHPAVGRGRTSGGGRAALTEIRYGTIDPALDPADAEGTRLWLAHSGPDLVDEVVRRGSSLRVTAETPEPWLVRDFVVEDALLVGDPRGTDAAECRTRDGRYLVPGSAWKGVVRSRAEYILRSRYPASAICDGGVRSDGKPCDDCPGCRVFGRQRQRGLLSFADSVVEAPELPVPRTHVSIDRVTGGSRDGLLFKTQPLTSGRLRLRVDALGPVESWVSTLIDHVLWDLHDGLIGIGSRVTRGMGTLRFASPPGNGGAPPPPRPGPVVVPVLEAGRKPAEVTP